MDNRTYVYIEPEKYLMDVLALLRSFYAEMDITPVVPESREDVKADAERTGYFFSIKIDADGKTIHVRADIDRTEMWISTEYPLPFVVRMKGNPLGIDWSLTPVPKQD